MEQKVLLFDLDGTLLDTEKYYQATWREAARRYGVDLTREKALELRSLGSPYVRAWFRELTGREGMYEIIHGCRLELMQKKIAECGIPLKAGAPEALQRLKEAGWRMGIVTAGPKDRADEYLRQVGIRGFFTDIISSRDVPFGKPAPDSYQYACAQMNVPCGAVFAVEDSPNGIRSAASAGCRAIMIPDLSEPEEELLPMIFQVLRNIGELPGFLERIDRYPGEMQSEMYAE